VRVKVSTDACTVNAAGSTAMTVRHAPEQAIEAPSGIVEVSKAVAIVRSRSSPRRSRRTRPTSVMMPVNMPVNYGSIGQFTRVLPPDGNPWSTGKSCEKAVSRPLNDRPYPSKRLIFGQSREQIPYVPEQRNKSVEQGYKIGDQGIKSVEHGRSSARRRRSSP